MADTVTKDSAAGMDQKVKLVPAAGVEPATFRSGGERSNPLSYAGKIRSRKDSIAAHRLPLVLENVNGSSAEGLRSAGKRVPLSSPRLE